MGIAFFGLDATRPHPRAANHAATIDLEFDDPAFVSWSYGNAEAIFSLLGVALDATGELAVPAARRAIMRARATFDRRAPALERPAHATYGAPRVLPDGTVALRPVRCMSFGLDADGIGVRLDAFERAVEALAGRGATHIAWA